MDSYYPAGRGYIFVVWTKVPTLSQYFSNASSHLENVASVCRVDNYRNLPTIKICADVFPF